MKKIRFKKQSTMNPVFKNKQKTIKYHANLQFTKIIQSCLATPL